jgi:hypothetical protein
MTGLEALSLLREGDKRVKRKDWLEGEYVYSFQFENYPSAILGVAGCNGNLRWENEIVGDWFDGCMRILDHFRYDDWEVVE